MNEPTPEDLLDEALSMTSSPWTLEPDEDDFSWHGYKCLCVRNSASGAWCGYVILPDSHPFCNPDGVVKDKDGEDWQIKTFVEDKLDVHGGVTFYDYVERSKAWFIGFDCNHFYDFAPGIAERVLSRRERKDLVNRGFNVEEEPKYRTLTYVRKELKRLVEQIKEYER